jgi:ubiquinone biosynthesis UbiH/UbiF/VisC/COQ6 family hydroxylase
VNRARLLVAGGGPVGLALAAACEGCEVDVIEACAPRAPAASGALDLRVYALSAGTRSLLRDIGAWDAIDARRIAPVRRMAVFGDESSSLAFTARPGESLAWIVEGDRMIAALEEAAATRPWIRLHRGSAARAYSAGADHARIELENGTALEGDLLVGADGPDSRVRDTFGIGAEEQKYDESAVVAHFACEKPHEGVARQWFRRDGVLAWLPLPGRRVSMVWSAPQPIAEELCAMEPGALATRVKEAGGAVLGELETISAVARFPLRLIRVEDPVKPGVVLVGDAAHAVHPLAGQGVNLGFQDARCLAHILAERSPLERAGDLRVLRRYARARREDVAAMQFVTDGLDQLFAARAPGIAALRNWGLRLVDRQDWAKRALAARAMR